MLREVISVQCRGVGSDELVKLNLETCWIIAPSFKDIGDAHDSNIVADAIRNSLFPFEEPDIASFLRILGKSNKSSMSGLMRVTT